MWRKRRIITAASALFILFAGCNKIKQIANIKKDIPFSQKVYTPKITGTPGSALPEELAVTFPPVAVITNSSEDLSQYHASSKKVSSVTLNSFSLATESIAPNFNYLDSVQISISTSDLPTELIAYKNGIPRGISNFDLDNANPGDLKNYFLEDTVYLHVTGYFNAIPPAATAIMSHMVFHLVANPLN